MPSAPSPAATDQELRDAYRLLDVDHRAAELAIRLCYRELVQLHHPDKWPHGSPEQAAADLRMRDINAAYDLIRDAPLQHASQPEPEEPQPLTDYEKAYRASHQLHRWSNIDFGAVFRFLFGTTTGASLVLWLQAHGVITSHVRLWMIVAPALIGLVFAKMSWLAGSLLREILGVLLYGRYRPGEPVAPVVRHCRQRTRAA
jgi:hypothetical protein